MAQHVLHVERQTATLRGHCRTSQSIGRSSVVHTQRGGTRCQAGWAGQRPGGLPPMLPPLLPPMLLPVAWPAVTLVDVPSTETE